MKRILAMVLSVAIIATIAIGGTVAYLQNTDDATNIADLGSVFVIQYEKERTRPDSTELRDFSQNQQAIPAVIDNSSSPAPGTIVSVADTTVTMPNHIGNFIDKIVYAQNDGKSPAYMRTFIAVPAGSYDASKDNGWLHLKFNTNANGTNSAWTMSTTKTTKTLKNSANKDQSFDIYTVTYNDPIDSGKCAVPSLLGFYVDSTVENAKDEDGKVYYTFGNTEIDLSRLEIKVATQAVQSDGFNDKDAAFNAAFIGELSTNPWAEDEGTDTPITSVGTAAELKGELTAFTETSGSKMLVLTKNKTYKIEGDWETFDISPYVNSGKLIIEGNGATITGLNNSLIKGGLGGEEIVIRNLTIDNNNATTMTAPADEQLGFGAFISSNQAKGITLENCHLKNTTITSTGSARLGGLIGYTSSVGDVEATVTVTNCSVVNCNITAAGSVGGIIGQAGGGGSVNHYITGCTVKSCSLNSTDDGDWRVGEVVGSVGSGTTSIKSTTTGSGDEANTLTQTGKTVPEHSRLYGRVTGGSLTIDDGAAITAGS